MYITKRFKPGLTPQIHPKVTGPQHPRIATRISSHHAQPLDHLWEWELVPRFSRFKSLPRCARCQGSALGQPPALNHGSLAQSLRVNETDALPTPAAAEGIVEAET